MLTADELDLLDDESRTIVDLTNLAQMAIWLVEGDLPSYTLAQDHFHSVFPGQIADLPPDVVQLHLMIKSQTGVESLASKTSEQQIDQLLDEALVNGLEEELRGLHGGFELTEADKTVVDSVKSRKEALQGEAQHQTELSQFPDGESEALSFSNDAAAAMREKYPADDLLRSFCIYVKGRLIAVSDLGAKFGLAMPQHDDNDLDLLSGPPVDGLNLDDLDSFFEKTTSGLVQNALAGLEDDHTPVPVIEEIEAPVEEPKETPKPEAEGPAPQTNGKVDLMTDYKELEALVAESTSNYVKTTLHGLSPVPYQPTVPTSTSKSKTDLDSMRVFAKASSSIIPKSSPAADSPSTFLLFIYSTIVRPATPSPHPR
jgi:protein TBF1